MFCMSAHHPIDVCSKPSCLLGTNLHFIGAFNSQEMIPRTGFSFWFISSQHIGAEQMDQKLPGLSRICKQLLEFWRQHALLDSILLKNGELLKELLESCSSLAWALTVQGRGWKRQWFIQSSSHLKLLTAPEPLPGYWTFFMCNFLTFQFIPSSSEKYQNKSVWKSIPFPQTKLGFHFVFVCLFVFK